MDLAGRLVEDMKQAMKSADKFRLQTIRLLRASIKNQEIAKQRSLDEQEILDVLSRELKQRRDSLLDFEKAEREDLVNKVKDEINIITDYLPRQLTEEEVKSIVVQTMQQINASSKAEMGKLMATLMPKMKGLADGKVVNAIVQQLLK